VPKETTSESGELDALRERTRELEAELEAVRRAHDAQARWLVSERLALADEIEREVGRLREEIEWRKGAMERYEEQLETLKSSRSLRYTEPLRWLAATIRRR
jgi:archaellum component FlaC